MASAEETRAEQLRKQVAKSRALRQQGVTFRVEKFPYMTRLEAMLGNERVGFLDLNEYDPKNKGREIKQVTVRPNFQRQGVASTLFNEAKKMGLNPLHSNQLSSEGKEFKASVGGRSVGPAPKTPEERRAQYLRTQGRKQIRKETGRKAAIDIARQRASGSPIDKLTDPVAKYQMAKLTGQAAIRPPVSFANMGLGAANVLGFLPALAEAGNIATGRSRAFDNVRMMR